MFKGHATGFLSYSFKKIIDFTAKVYSSLLFFGFILFRHLFFICVVSLFEKRSGKFGFLMFKSDLSEHFRFIERQFRRRQTLWL